MINIWEFNPGPTLETCNLYFLVDFKFRSPLYRQEVEDFEIGLVRRDPDEEELTSNKQQAKVEEEPIPHEPVPEETAEEVPNEAENARNTPEAESVPGETSERRVPIRDF